MTKAANSHDKPSPSDDATHAPVDKGHKSKIEKEDKEYHADQPKNENIAKKHENDEQPVTPIKKWAPPNPPR